VRTGVSYFRDQSLLQFVALAGAASPGLWLFWRVLQDRLGVDPVATLTHETGRWALYFVLLSLAATPLRRLTGWNWPVRIRRTLGLAAFVYASFHFTVFLVFDHFFDWNEILKDILKRPFITLGFATWVMMLPLAATSSQYMMKWIGGSRWRTLHKLNYLIGTTGVFHYFWSVKRDVTLPALYALVLALLFGLRLVRPEPVRR